MVFADTDHCFGKHTHDQFGIGLIVRGAQKSSSQNGLVEAMAGDIITVNPEEVHDGSPLGEGGRAWRMVYLNAEVMQGRVSQLNEAGIQARMEFLHPQVRDPALAQCFERHVKAAMDSSPGWTLPFDESLLLLLKDLLRPAVCPPLRLHQTGIARVKSWVDGQPANPWSLAELARQADLSQFQFIRHFSRATGLTPHAYILQRRIQMARRMIRQGERLGDVAAASGFADQSHMTRHFVRSFGLSPGAYLRAVSSTTRSRNFVQDPER
ncbi:MAG: AraC family transcriptional regulator [Curvibacter sp.]|nr:MAG: AraC family transcriptional regulator [Curvibacter sp.]